MQNIVEETLQVGQSIRTGGAKYLLMRDASNSVSLQLDANEPVEVKKNDVILIEGCVTVIFHNHHSSPTTIEYQITDTAINTQSDAVAINGAVKISDIEEPIVISHVQNDVGVLVNNEIAISNYPDIQKVAVTNQGNALTFNTLTPVVIGNKNDNVIPKNSNRVELLVTAPKANRDTIIIAGVIPLEAGGHTTIAATNALIVTGKDGDMLNVGEFV
ncbi:hypothetical protein [Vibrio sp. VB16]|uniref:hypothetical protein n=1 Tax=Vibrio sp. VB16 TaxID=2785746 RepID=UPI00189D9B3B|nr:hypothetical protein [Vibrio sp. VB16]UGA55289.1 hypothetical protein IUZ65_002755 [Vibrio sp. VB16]